MADPVNLIAIWQPRYFDRKVLIATDKIRNGANYIVFTKSERHAGKVYYLNGETAKNCKISTNGKIEVYEIPMEYLRRIKDSQFFQTEKEDDDK